MNEKQFKEIIPSWEKVEKKEVTILVDKKLADLINNKEGYKEQIEEKIYYSLEKLAHEYLIGENIPTYEEINDEVECNDCTNCLHEDCPEGLYAGE